MKSLRKNSLLLAILAILTFGLASCGGSKMSKKEYQAQLETATADLNAIIDGTTSWNLDEQAARVAAIKAMEFKEKDRNTINDLIEKAEAKIAEQKAAIEAEAARKAEEERLRQEELERQRKAQGPSTIEEFLVAIPGVTSIDKANEYINKALNLFASPDVPVLIAISRFGDTYDYDAPTTAEKYLNYLKDQKKLGVRVNNVVKDANGKITELELIKLNVK